MDRKKDKRGWIFVKAGKQDGVWKYYIFVTMSFFACNRFSESYTGFIDYGKTRVESSRKRLERYYTGVYAKRNIALILTFYRSMNMTELNNDIELTFSFKAAERVEKRKLGDLPINTILTLLQYGTRKGNDYVNSAFASEANEKTRDELVTVFMDKVDSGDFEATRDTSESDFKAFVVNVLKANGASAKSLKGLKASELIDLIALKANKPSAEVEKALKAKFEAQKAALKAAMESLKI